MGKEASADNEIEGAVEFEEEWLTGLEDFEGGCATPGLPEIDFVNVRDVRDDLEPVIVSDADP